MKQPWRDTLAAVPGARRMDALIMPPAPTPPNDLPLRVAVLEEIARNMSVALTETRADVQRAGEAASGERPPWRRQTI